MKGNNHLKQVGCCDDDGPGRYSTRMVLVLVLVATEPAPADATKTTTKASQSFQLTQVDS